MTNLLFQPVNLGSIELPNRILMAPMTRNRAEADGTPNELMAAYYTQRASAGLLISEMTVVSDQGRSYLNAPGLYTESHQRGWRTVTDAVHAAGGRMVVQLAHGGRISHPSLQPGGQTPVAPSAIRPDGHTHTTEGRQPYVTPRALETHEIPGIVAQFRHAAQFALAAGLDGVEIHAANGYLLDQFLRDGTNDRTDQYGGSPENRARLLVEVATAVASIFGRDKVGVRISPFNTYNDISDSDPVGTFTAVASMLAPLHLAYLHVVDPVTSDGPAITGALKDRFRGPVVANGGYTALTANSVLAEGKADAVAFGAPFIANPDLPERFANGLPMRAPDPATFYTGGPRGYVDYLAARATA